MKLLSSNRELYDYLLLLAAALKERKCDPLSEALVLASRQITGNMSTEFLGESRIALRRTFKGADGVLTTQERNDLADVLTQLDEAFNRR